MSKRGRGRGIEREGVGEIEESRGDREREREGGARETDKQTERYRQAENTGRQAYSQHLGYGRERAKRLKKWGGGGGGIEREGIKATGRRWTREAARTIK